MENKKYNLEVDIRIKFELNNFSFKDIKDIKINCIDKSLSVNCFFWMNL